MKFEGRELKTGSDYYAAAMKLMQRDDIDKCVCGAVALFIAGAELRDKFCIVRLKEVVNTPKYWNSLSAFAQKDLIDSMIEILKLECAEKEWKDMQKRLTKGVFGVYAPRPINHEAAMGFQSKKRAIEHWHG